MKIARALFVAGYRIPHAIFSLQFDCFIENIDHTYVFTNCEPPYLKRIFENHNVDTSDFSFIHDSEMDARWPTMRKWILPDDFRGTWLYQQALKLASIEYCDADVTLIQDPDTFCIKPYNCLTPEGKPKLFILPNETHSQGYYRALDSLGIQRQTPHCFVSEFMPVYKEDWLRAKEQLKRLNNCDPFDAIFDAVPYEDNVNDPSAPRIKWFSEYEFLGNWIMTQREVEMLEQKRFCYTSLDQLKNLSYDYNCCCDAIPRLDDSIQFDWSTRTVVDFEKHFNVVKKFLPQEKKREVFCLRYQVDPFVEWFGPPYQNANFTWTEDYNKLNDESIKILGAPVFFTEYDEYKNNPIDLSSIDLFLISDIESNPHQEVKDWLKKLNPKHYLIAHGSVFKSSLEENEIYKPYWMFNIINRNKFQEIISWDHMRNTVTSVPIYDFDALLGAKKHHRTFIMANMQASGLLKTSIVNYLEVFTSPFQEDVNPYYEQYYNKILLGEKVLYPYLSPNLDTSWEVTDNFTKSVSDLVPWEIYRNTKYSIVAETNGIDTSNVFLTEKTGKCLFAKRVFIMFAAKGYLAALKALGFKTFDCILDESYDNIEDDLERWKAAWCQVEYLQKQDYREIIPKVKPILDHNHKRLLEYKQEINDRMQQMVYNKIEEIKC